LRCKIGTGATDELELRLDGTLVAVGTGLNMTDLLPGRLTAGADSISNPGGFVYVDDVAVNDDQGTDQNSWPGEGKIVLLKPVSDDGANSNIGADAWRAGNSGTTNLWTAVDNTPPVGAISPGTTTSQIVCDTPSVARGYRALTDTYTNAGIGASDTITLLQQLAVHGEAVSTGTKAGDIQYGGNCGSTEFTNFNYGDDAGAAGAFPTGWKLVRNPVVYSPSVATGTAAGLDVGHQANTRNGMICFMGLYVEYVLAAAGLPPARPLIASQAVQRAATR
jgi:hypothetical protein